MTTTASDGTGEPVAARLHAGQPAPALTLGALDGAEVRIGELAEAGLREVAVFHSAAETMRPYQGDLPFAVVADPDRAAYRRYGVGSSLRSILDPRAWPGFLRGAVARHRSSSFTGEGGHTGLPADFLITPDGAIIAAKYGVHADDQWSVDEILELASAWRAGGGSPQR